MWLKRIAQAPPTYLGIGHNYVWDENRYKELWETKKSSPRVILWWFQNGEIYQEERNTKTRFHWLDPADGPARGRLDTEKMVGSITFDTPDEKTQKIIMDKIYQKFISMGYKMYIYERGGPYSFDQYYQKL